MLWRTFWRSLQQNKLLQNMMLQSYVAYRGPTWCHISTQKIWSQNCAKKAKYKTLNDVVFKRVRLSICRGLRRNWAYNRQADLTGITFNTKSLFSPQMGMESVPSRATTLKSKGSPTTESTTIVALLQSSRFQVQLPLHFVALDDNQGHYRRYLIGPCTNRRL